MSMMGTISAAFSILFCGSSALAQPAIGAAMDRSADGSIIVVMYRPDLAALDILRVGADDSVVPISRIGCPPVSSVAVGDTNGDGLKEFALSLTDGSAVVLLTVGQGGVMGGQIVQTDEPAVAVLAVSIVEGGQPILVTIGSTGIAYSVVSTANAPPTGPIDSGTHCDTTWEQCGAECSCSPIFPGIQACLEAARCRASNCHWSACILHESGAYGQVRTNLANIACGAVYATEMVTCFPVQLLPR
jgi:hypothetical protein